MQKSDLYSDNNFGPDQILPAKSFKTSDPDGTVRIYKTENGPSSEEPKSVYSFFKQNAEKYQDHPALMVKRNGDWKKWSYMEYFNDACTVAKALIKLGLERFHGVCIMGYNNPEWMISSYGAVFAGGFSAGVYTTNSPEACFSVADNCKAQIIIVEDKTCLDKFLAVKRLLPDIKALIQWSGEPDTQGVITWSELMAIGAHEPDEILQRRLSLAAVNHCCNLVYTSGTTGPPKGVMLSQDQMTWAPNQYREMFGCIDKEDVVLSFLPLSHLAGQMGDMYNSVHIGATVYFAPPDALKGTLGQLLLEVRPTVFVGVPRVWEKIYEKMQEVGANAGLVKKSVGAWAKYHGLNNYKALREGRELSSSEKLKYVAAKMLVLNKVRQAIGLDRARFLMSGGAPIDPEVLEYLFSLDIPVMELYGLSESLSFCSFSSPKPHCFKFGSVGKVLNLNEVTLMHTDEQRKGEGEICIRGRNVCMGYLRMPDKTDETIDDNGWLRTGDLGWLDLDGFLYITGRLKELVITSGGENVPPVLIEDAVKKELPCISNAMLVGDKRHYLSLLLTFKSEVNLNTGEPLQELTPLCQKWMRENGCQATTVKEAIDEIENHSGGPLVEAIQRGIDSYNTLHAISNAQNVQRWTFLPHDFSLFTQELSNTLKLKRSFVLQKYAHIVDAMYSSNENLKSKL